VEGVLGIAQRDDWLDLCFHVDRQLPTGVASTCTPASPEGVDPTVLHRYGLPRQGSCNGSDHSTSLLSFERTAAEDLSGLPAGGRRTRPVSLEATPKDLCGRRGLRSSERAPSRPLLRPRLPEATGQRALSVAEADGNRTRRRALARPPILKTGRWFPTVGERWGRPAELLRRNRSDLEG